LVPLLERVIQSPHIRERLLSYDDHILKQFPQMAHFATIRVMSLQPKVLR
jgi:hypothetical protein